MENHLIIVEIVALLTGLTVIIIETVIIFMLKRHINALDTHFIGTENLITDFENKIDHHLDHLNEHSHEIEAMLKQICDHDLGLHEKNISGIKTPKMEPSVEETFRVGVNT